MAPQNEDYKNKDNLKNEDGPNEEELFFFRNKLGLSQAMLSSV